MKCPDCGCEKFYVKDPQDAFEAYGFECPDPDRQVRFDDDVDPAEAPEIRDETETYCERCAWHDKFSSLKK